MTATTDVDNTPAGYLDENARDDRLRQLSSQLGGEVVSFGTSVEGRALSAAVIPATTAAAPTVFINGNLHGVEWIGGLCALGVLEALGTPRGQWLRERARVVVAPCLNPDGFAATARSLSSPPSSWSSASTTKQQGTLKDLRTNKNGVDLNRNFPRPNRDERHGGPWADQAALLAVSGSSDPRRATWRGTAPLSEPEARAVDGLLSRYAPHVVISFHSFMGTLIPPKVTTWRDASTYRRLCRAWRRGQPHRFAPTFMFAPVDVFTGELEDHAHHVHGAWALTVEVFPLWRTFAQHLVAPSLFARFNPRDPAITVDDAVGGCLACVAAALDTPRPSVRFST
ncbi:MAG TPA: M14 family metallopeptidase [Myxococcota bacterium]